MRKQKAVSLEYTTDYIHPLYRAGNIFISTLYGRYQILGKLKSERRGYYVIQFEETGHITKNYCSQIKKGNVSDRSYNFGNEEERKAALMLPVIHGVGYIGDGPHRTYIPYSPETHGQRTKEYVLWQNMIQRCYYTKNGKHVHKGYKGVTVCERWHCFQLFASDLKAIPGYSKWAESPHLYEFDKDISHRRHYSPETVAFIPTDDNAREAGLRSRAMKIAKDDYYRINKSRGILLDEAREALSSAGFLKSIDYEIVLHQLTHTIIADTPYGTVVFFPFTKKVMRSTYCIDGDVEVFIQYLSWLKRQWSERNPSIDCYEVRS